jgi:hypothetical protein
MFNKKTKCNKCSTCKRAENHIKEDTFYRDDDVTRFKLTFGMCDGNEGEFVGTTKEIRDQIDNHVWNHESYYHRWNNDGLPTYKKEWELKRTATNISILKYGYFWEFKEEYDEVDYTIDNSLGITIKRM